MSLPRIPDVTQYSKYVTCILGQNASPFTLQGTNTYLVGDPASSERVLIDTGSGLDPYGRILQSYLETHNLKITALAITHSHPDHIGGISQVLRFAPLARVYKFIEPDSYDTNVAKYGITHWGDRETIEAGNVHLTAYFTPGHCRDHISIWLEEEQVLFSGDNLLGHGSSVFEDYRLYMNSLQQMRDLPFLRRVYPGHGVVIENGVAAFNSYIEHRYERVSELLAALRSAGTPLTDEELVERVYKDFKQKPRTVQAGAIGNTQHYLAELERQGRVLREGELWKPRL